MGLFDLFKRKKKEPEKKIEKKIIKKPLEKKAPVSVPPSAELRRGKEVKPEEKIKPAEPKPKKKVSDKAHKILFSPHITEKAADSEKENKYVFKVWPGANKTEVKQAIEDTYGVDVVGVRIINIPRRKRRLGRRTGWKKGYKKAVAKVKQGQKIEILPR